LKRGDAVYREVTRQLADDKVMSKKEKEDRVLWKKNEVADYEASMFSIFYQNTFFFALFLIFSFFLFASMNPIFNCLASIYGAAGKYS
jgi:translocon-associated protein subunit gamma